MYRKIAKQRHLKAKELSNSKKNGVICEVLILDDLDKTCIEISHKILVQYVPRSALVRWPKEKHAYENDTEFFRTYK